jgi:hypothetical protein
MRPHLLKHIEQVERKKLEGEIKERSEALISARSFGPGLIYLKLAKEAPNFEIKTKLMLEACKYIDQNIFQFHEVADFLKKELAFKIKQSAEGEEKNELINLIREETIDFLERSDKHSKNSLAQEYTKLVNKEAVVHFRELLGAIIYKYNLEEDKLLLEKVSKLARDMGFS